MTKLNKGTQRAARKIAKPPRGRCDPSLYDRYQMPFFDLPTLSVWKVRHTGSYSGDYEQGYAYGLRFLNSCDRTVGWTVLLGQIVSEMVAAGPMRETWPDGTPRSNGIILGFMRAVGEALACVLPDDHLLTGIEAARRWRNENVLAQMADQ